MAGTDAKSPLAGSQVTALVGWWVDELAKLAVLRRQSRPLWRGMLARTEDGGFDVHVRQGRATQLLARLDPAQPGEGAGEIAAELARKGVSAETLVLRLAPYEVIATQLTLPVVVRDMLGPVLRNQLERVAPWPAEQAVFAFREAGTTEDGAQLNVDLWVAGRARLDKLLAELAALGLKPGIVDTAATVEEEPRINLIGREYMDAARRRQTVSRLLTGAAVATMAASAVGLGYAYYLGVQRDALEQAIQREMQVVTAAASPQDAEARRQRDKVLEQRRRFPSLSIALEALSRALPDDAYLERIEMRDGIMILSGKAQNVPALIGPLEAARHFDNVQFAAPTTRPEGSSIDVFSLSFKVRPSMSLEAAR